MKITINNFIDLGAVVVLLAAVFFAHNWLVQIHGHSGIILVSEILSVSWFWFRSQGFCRHSWGKWEEAKGGGQIINKDDSIIGKFYIQKHECDQCGLIEFKKQTILL